MATKKKILVVDDEPDLLKFTLIRLKSIGYEVYGCKDGKEALELAQKVVPDLMILDIYLPVMDGDDVAKVAKENEKLKNIPVVLISATTKSLAQRGRECGAKAWFTKPFEAEDLINTIKKLIGE